MVHINAADFDTSLTALRAIAEETRLRITQLLCHGELTVSDLSEILGQSQPRLSRHLKLLVDAQVVQRHKEGSWSFFSLQRNSPIATLVESVISSIDPTDPQTSADAERLEEVRVKRSTSAAEYFAQIADQWDRVRLLHAEDHEVEAAITKLLGQRSDTSLLDIGTGTARMLSLLCTTQHQRCIGVDSSHSMLSVARANLDRETRDGRPELANVELRQGDIYSLALEPGGFDLVVIHQVLHFLDRPGWALREAARQLSPNGRLLIVDFAPHELEFLRKEHAHRNLGIRDEAMQQWLQSAGLSQMGEATVESPSQKLSVRLWLASKNNSDNHRMKQQQVSS